ncbi:Alpha/Beta hydrolase protein [Aspergillus karnatakaensis]|uniref:alpha/beta hydrolase n=1 Tax=Aspergillus karnatakaensis TaxID=1810916 RepID=UPI003CCD0EE8
MAQPPTYKTAFNFLAFLCDCGLGAISGLVVRPKQWTYRRHLKYLVVRSFRRRGLYALMNKRNRVSTMEVYTEYMKRHSLGAEVIELDAGARGGWIGPSNSKRVLLYLHGGAYISGCHPSHIEILGDLVTAARQKGEGFAVLVLQYGVAPRTKYPEQLIQAAIALKYLLDSKDLDPEDVILGADSAGANLAIALMSHIVHPHPAVPHIQLPLGKKLAGTFFFSPWVNFGNEAPSMKSNFDKDFISEAYLRASSSLFLGGAPVDNYNTPLRATSAWWQDIPVQSMCIVAGEYEMLRDDIVAWTNTVQIHKPHFELYIEPGGIHTTAVFDRALKLGMACSEERLREWVIERLKAMSTNKHPFLP